MSKVKKHHDDEEDHEEYVERWEYEELVDRVDYLTAHIEDLVRSLERDGLTSDHWHRGLEVISAPSEIVLRTKKAYVDENLEHGQVIRLTREQAVSYMVALGVAIRKHDDAAKD